MILTRSQTFRHLGQTFVPPSPAVHGAAATAAPLWQHRTWQGRVALLWSCNASLIGDMAATFELLQDTADPPNDAGNCGVPADGEGNFTYGYGYLNVLTAGQQVCAAGMIHGTVTDGTSPVEGATVTADNGGGLSMDTLSRANGTYTLFVPAGTYTVSATKNVYSEDIETDVVVVKGQKTTVNFVITPSNLFSGHVMGFEACDVNPAALEGATVNFWQGTTIVATTTTNAAGYYSCALPAGTYDIEFIMDGFVTDYAEEVDLAAGETVTVDFTLRLIAPCISVNPTSLEQTQTADTTTTQTLTIMNTGAGDATVELMEIDGGFQPSEGPFIGKVPSYQYLPEKDLPGLDKSKIRPIEQNANPGISTGLLDVLINEGFETLFPPSGWAQVINNPSYTWIQSTAMYYGGQFMEPIVPWNYTQDEWLLTPEFVFSRRYALTIL